jgi:predicted Zn finger-like uncharacterized protein
MNRIIQCPACNTKFALNETQLSGLDNPKFHCSRCNTVFTLQTHENPVKDHISAATKEEITQPEIEAENDTDSPDEEIIDTQYESFTQNDSNLNVDEVDENIGINQNPTVEDDDAIDTSIEDPDSVEKNDTTWHLGEDTSSDKSNSLQENTEDANTSYDSLHFDQEEDDKDETDNQQLSLFSKKSSEVKSSIEPGMLFVEDTNDIDEIKGIKVSWESSNPDIPHEVDLGKNKNLPVPSSDIPETFDTKETKVLSRATVKKEVDEIDSLEPDSPQEELAPKSLNELFKRESRKNKNPVHVTGTHTKIEHTEEPEQTEDEVPSDLAGDIPLQSITPKYNEEIASTTNRSMKHTTIVKRDELEISGFVDDDEFEDDEFFEAPQILRKNKYKKISSFPRIGLSTPSLPRITLTEAYRSFIIAWSLPFIFMAVLVTWSYQLSDSPFSKTKERTLSSRMGKLMGLDTALRIKMPPQGVSFSPVYAYLSLSKDKKTPWLILTGHVLNSSSSPISSMEIASIFYDENQNLVFKETSLIPNSLSEFNFNSFTDEEIIENSKNKPSLEISQNTSKKVIIAIKDNPKAKWFASRVYSTTL